MRYKNGNGATASVFENYMKIMRYKNTLGKAIFQGMEGILKTIFIVCGEECKSP